MFGTLTLAFLGATASANSIDWQNLPVGIETAPGITVWDTGDSTYDTTLTTAAAASIAPLVDLPPGGATLVVEQADVWSTPTNCLEVEVRGYIADSSGLTVYTYVNTVSCDGALGFTFTNRIETPTRSFVIDGKCYDDDEGAACTSDLWEDTTLLGAFESSWSTSETPTGTSGIQYTAEY